MVELNVKSKITELLRENICDFMLGKDFFFCMRQKPQFIKDKKDK